MSQYSEILTKYWGYSSFRPLQEDIIKSIVEGKDTLGLMPTGGGKSITFQVPAMAMQGICIVVTPLIALMKDQVDNLRTIGIKATTVYTGMSRDEIITQLDNSIFGNYKFLYISPERLGTELFRSKLRAMNVCMLVVDESHCISQWGYDFRPSYLKIAEIRELLPHIPVLALTATATPDVVNDIQEKLHFKEKNVFRKSFIRDNLSYIVRYVDDKNQALIHLLNRVPGTAIVYVRNRKMTKEIASVLAQADISANFFHAGLKREEKDLRQNQWKDNTCRVIVSTNAFGMGIDKPDVRLVVHMDMPTSLEEYFQEAGRAGRDEKKAYAVALCSPSETTKLKRRISDQYPDKKFIIKIYDTLGSYLQIALGFGLFTTHDFFLADFCGSHKLPIQQTHYALKILELAGYTEYNEEPDNSSRFKFLIQRDELYQLTENSLTEDIIQIILRAYTGLFADYVYIDESMIAGRLGINREQVYNHLISLAKRHIISYIPRKKVPQITFTRTREEPQYIVLPKNIYEERKKHDEFRINKMLEYITNKHICRTRILLNYFGEKSSGDCKSCDVCLAKTQSGLTQWEFNSVREHLIKILEKSAQDINTLANTLPLEPHKNIQVIRFLLDNDNRFTISDTLISLKK